MIISNGGGEASFSGNAVVPAGDVVENGRTSCPLLAGERIESSVRIALAGCGVLHDKRHQSGERRSGGGGATDDVKSSVLIHEITIMAGRGKRNVRNIAFAIGGNTGSSLPGWLGIKCARATTAGPKST